MRLLTALLSSLALAPSLLAQRIPEVEPNDTNATAQAIPVGAQIDCTLAAANQDWFSFTVASATRLRVHTSGLTTGADTRIALLDSTGTVYLGIDDDARGSTTSNFASDITLNVAAGTYMVQVVGFNSTSAGGYSLEVGELTPVVYDGTESEAAPGGNDAVATAIPTGTLGTGVKRYLGNIAPATVVLTDSVAAAPATNVYSGACQPAAAVVFSGTVGVPTAVASTTTVTQAVTSLPAANPLLGSYASPASSMSLLFTSGVNIGLSRPITASTVFTLTTTAFPAAATSGDTFQIVTGPNTTTATWVPSLPLASLFVGGSAYSLRMTSGANIGVSRAISANSGPSAFGTVITTAAFPVANAPGDTFEIDMTVATTAVFTTTSTLVPGAYNPTTGASSLGQYQLRFTSGANVGQTRQIAGNTASTITSASTYPSAPTAGDTFVIEKVDCDYYQINLTAPTNGFWFQINEGDAPAVYGHKYELYDASGNALLPTGATQMLSYGTQSATCSTLAPRTSSARVLPAGTYYLSVRAPNAPFVGSSTMPVGVVPSGNYMLEIFTSRMDVNGTTGEIEPNNALANATPLVPGQIGTGNITNGTDTSDFWGPIVINTPSTLFYQTRRAGTATPLLDSTIRLVDSANNIALTSTSGNVIDAPWTTSSAHGRGIVSFFAPGTYYLEVVSPGTGFGQSGDYELQLGEIIATPYVTASYATFTANASCGVAPFPTLTREFPSEVPAVGTMFARQITNMTPNFVGLHVLGLANTTPLDLGVAFGGTPGVCFLNISPDVVYTIPTSAAGTAELQLVIPPVTGLRGTILWDQCFDLDLTAPNGFALQGSNYGRMIIGERSF